MRRATLSIGRLENRVLVAREHPAPERVRGEVDAAVAAGLRRALAAAFPAGLDSDASVWVVRKLEVESDVHVAWDADALATAIGASIARSVTRAIAGPGDGVNVVRFASPAAHLARFLADRAAGHAGQWYHRRFAGLSMLPLSAALRTAVLREAATGLRALCALEEGDLHAVVLGLSRQDARAVLDALATLPGAIDPDRATRAIAAAWAARPPGFGEPALDALALVVRAARSSAAPCGSSLVPASAAFVDLAWAVASLDAEERARFVAALRAGEGTLLVRLAAAATAAVLATIGLAEATRAAVADALELAGHDKSGSAEAAETTTLVTRFGGMFLLLPDLDVDLDGARFGEALADLDGAGCEPASLARLLVLAECLRPGGWSAVAGDRVVREACGVASDAEIGAWMHAPPARVIAAAHAGAAVTLRRFAARLAGFADASAAHVRRSFLEVSARVDREPERLVVTLGRPPLYVVLALSGLSRRSYQLPWLDVPVEIYPEA